MKKIFDKKIIYGVIIGGILFGSIGVLATNYLYKSDQVSYDGDKTDITNVEAALDDLFTKLDNIKNEGDATADDISIGKTAVVKGEKIVGINTAQKSISGKFYVYRHNLSSGLTGHFDFYNLPPCTISLSYAKGSNEAASRYSFILSKYTGTNYDSATDKTQIYSGLSPNVYEINEPSSIHIYTWQNVSTGTSSFTIDYTITFK